MGRCVSCADLAKGLPTAVCDRIQLQIGNEGKLLEQFWWRNCCSDLQHRTLLHLDTYVPDTGLLHDTSTVYTYSMYSGS